MPYKLIKVKGKNLYKVINELTGKVHSKGSTLSDAEKQIRIMEFFDNTTRKNKVSYEVLFSQKNQLLTPRRSKVMKV